MPRQNTCPADFPPFILSQIEQVAQHIVATRKARGETQAQWAQRLGISQPTMARLERGDPAIATATYVMCLWLVNPQLNLLQLLPSAPPAPTPTICAGASATKGTGALKPRRSNRRPPWTSWPICWPPGACPRCNAAMRCVLRARHAPRARQCSLIAKAFAVGHGRDTQLF